MGSLVSSPSPLQFPTIFFKLSVSSEYQGAAGRKVTVLEHGHLVWNLERRHTE